jgi:hypothetical protein
MLRAKSMPLITRDKFALAVESDGEALDAEAITAVLHAAGAVGVEVIDREAPAGPVSPRFLFKVLVGIGISCLAAGYLTYWGVKIFPVSVPMVHMLVQPRLDPQSESTFFTNGSGMRMPVAGTVVDPAADTTVFSLAAYLKGGYFSDSSAREIILGAKLAAEFGVDTGDFVTLFALTKYDSRNADEFRVVGLLNTSDPTLNRSAAYITYAAANDFLDLEGLVTEADIAIARRVNLRDMSADAGHVKQRIDASFSGLHAATFMELGAEFLEDRKSVV